MTDSRTRRSHLRLVSLVFMVLLALVVAACGKAPTPSTGGGTAEGPKVADHLNVRIHTDVVSLIPGLLNAPPETAVAMSIYSGLVKFKAGTTQVIGDLAETWGVSADGLAYTFQLRKGVKWHKGFGELTSKDVKASFDWMMDKKNASPFIGDLGNVAAIDTSDDYKVIIRLKKPQPSFPEAVLCYRPGLIMKKEALDKFGTEYSANAVGTGPYVLEQWVPGDRLILKANPDYFGEKPKTPTVNFVIIKEEATFESALETGAIDIGYSEDASVGARLVKSTKVGAQAIPSSRTWVMQFNLKRKPFDDVRVRQAIWWSLNKQEIVDGVFSGAAVPTDTLLSQWQFGQLKDVAYKQDLVKAKDLLNQAGVGSGFKVTLNCIASNLSPQIATVVKEQLAKVGIQVEIRVEEWATMTTQRRNGDFDFNLIPHLRPASDQYFGELLHSVNIPFPNSGGYKGMDALIDQAKSEMDQAKRKDIYFQMQRQVWADAPVIPLVQPSFVLAFGPKVRGALPGNLTYNLADIYVSK